MRRIAYCLIVVFGILGCSDLMFAQTPTATSTYSDITTDDATDITSNSATLNATIPLFTTAGAAYFEYGTTSGNGNATSNTHANTRPNTDLYTCTMRRRYYFGNIQSDRRDIGFGDSKRIDRW